MSTQWPSGAVLSQLSGRRGDQRSDGSQAQGLRPIPPSTTVFATTQAMYDLAVYSELRLLGHT